MYFLSFHPAKIILFSKITRLSMPNNKKCLPRNNSAGILSKEEVNPYATSHGKNRKLKEDYRDGKQGQDDH